jgi:hypothetical protein
MNDKRWLMIVLLASACVAPSASSGAATDGSTGAEEESGTDPSGRDTTPQNGSTTSGASTTGEPDAGGPAPVELELCQRMNECGFLPPGIDASDCAPPSSGTAEVACGAITGTAPECHLDCSEGQSCPDGMLCWGDAVCVWSL